MLLLFFFSRSACVGVPKSRRGEIWVLLCHQYRLHHRLPQRQAAPDTPYHDLLKQLTAQQHAILVDLGGRGAAADSLSLGAPSCIRHSCTHS